MSGRVTRKKNRRRNSGYHDWALVSSPEDVCQDLRHDVVLANLHAQIQIFGVFDDEKLLDWGCLVWLLPVCQLNKSGTAHPLSDIGPR